MTNTRQHFDSGFREPAAPIRPSMWPVGGHRTIALRPVASFLMLSWLLLSTSIGAVIGQEKPVVIRASLEPEKETLVGQRVLMRIDVLGGEGWANIETLPLIEVPGAIVYTPQDHSTRMTESIGGESYSGQRYEWWVYPLAAGQITIPKLQLNVVQKPFGANAKPTESTHSVASQTFVAKLPDGINADTRLVCAEDIKASQSWQPADRKSFKLGDGITRVITRKIEDAPAMILAPLPVSETPAIRQYLKQPDVSDQSDRGRLTGTRVDSTTYVFESSGSHSIPDIELPWWNTSTNQLETILLPGLEFEIEQTVQAVDESETGPALSRKNRIWLWGAFATLTGGVAIAFFLRKPIAKKISEWQQSACYRERNAFRSLIKAAGTNERRESLNRLVRWANFLLPDEPSPQLQTLVQTYGDKQAQTAFNELLNALEHPETDWNGTSCVTAINRIRRKWIQQRWTVKAERSNPLPELNPSTLQDR